MIFYISVGALLLHQPFLRQVLEIPVQRLFLDLRNLLQAVDILKLRALSHTLLDLSQRHPADALVVIFIILAFLVVLQMHLDP